MAERNRKFRTDRKRHSNKYLFSTLICCKECGWSFRRVSRTYRNTYVRWVCSKRNGQGANQCENKTAVDENELIEKLDEYFQSLIQDKRKIAQMLRQELRRASTNADTAAEEKILLQDRLSKLEKTRQKYLELYADDLITRQELDKKLRSTRAEVEQLQTRLQQLQFSALSESAIDRVIDQVFQSLDDFLTVRNLGNGQLKRLISKVEVDKDGNVDVYLHLFNELLQGNVISDSLNGLKWPLALSKEVIRILKTFKGLSQNRFYSFGDVLTANGISGLRN